MITRPASVLREDGAPDFETVRECIREHRGDLPRLAALQEYYGGRHPIRSRVRPSGMPNTRISHGYPRYIVTMAAGYLMGAPVRYENCPEALTRALADMDAQSVDMELARQAGIFGRAVELCYADGNARPRSAAVSPLSAFVVYDDTVEHRPLFGVQMTALPGETGGVRITVCTAKETMRWEAASPDTPPRAVERAPHYFSGVPMVEYWNGEDERGDFEPVLDLIDAYDTLQSDRVNDKRQFVDALLVITGACLEETAENDPRPPARRLREDRVLQLPDSSARAEWLCRQLQESDVEVLRAALAGDIHKLSLVPDLSDERFAANCSGVAMQYKLMGLNQLTRVKERWFREGLRTRLRLFAAFLRSAGRPVGDVEDVRILFSRALPADEEKLADTVQKLRGLVPDEALRAHIPFLAEGV